MSDFIESIICKNEIKSVLSKLEEILKKNPNIKTIKLVDENESEVVLLVSNNSISDREASMWWSGYQAFLKA